MAFGIACAATGNKEALGFIEFMKNEQKKKGKDKKDDKKEKIEVDEKKEKEKSEEEKKDLTALFEMMSNPGIDMKAQLMVFNLEDGKHGDCYDLVTKNVFTETYRSISIGGVVMLDRAELASEEEEQVCLGQYIAYNILL